MPTKEDLEKVQGPPIYEQISATSKQLSIVASSQNAMLVWGSEKIRPHSLIKVELAPNQTRFVASGAQMAPIVVMTTGEHLYPAKFPCFLRTSLRAIRLLQLILSLALLGFVCAYLGLLGKATCYDYWYADDVCGDWYPHAWIIVPPLITVISTSVQLSAKNPVNPGCSRKTPVGRGASDLAFAILHTVCLPLLASIVWLFSPIFVFNNIAYYVPTVLALTAANVLTAILSLTYWITFGNVIGCCFCMKDF